MVILSWRMIWGVRMVVVFFLYIKSKISLSLFGFVGCCGEGWEFGFLVFESWVGKLCLGSWMVVLGVIRDGFVKEEVWGMFLVCFFWKGWCFGEFCVFLRVLVLWLVLYEGIWELGCENVFCLWGERKCFYFSFKLVKCF